MHTARKVVRGHLHPIMFSIMLGLKPWIRPGISLDRDRAGYLFCLTLDCGPISAYFDLES